MEKVLIIKINADKIIEICKFYNNDLDKLDHDMFFDNLYELANYAKYTNYPYISLNDHEYKKIRRYINATR